MRWTWAAALVIASAGVLTVEPVTAQQTGMDAMHDKVRVGQKTCMSDHFHDGKGLGKSQKEATAAAIKSWQDFTGWEYGPAWGSFKLSESKKITCSRSTTSEFDCHVTSRPCRGGAVAPRRKRRR